MTEVVVVLSENDVGFGNLAGALSGRLPGVECPLHAE